MSGTDWDLHYQNDNPPWETGRPSEELRRVIAEHKIQPGRVIELGCGTGINAIWLAQQGFAVTEKRLANGQIQLVCAKG